MLWLLQLSALVNEIGLMTFFQEDKFFEKINEWNTRAERGITKASRSSKQKRTCSAGVLPL